MDFLRIANLMNTKYNVAKSTKNIDQYWQWEREKNETTTREVLS